MSSYACPQCSGPTDVKDSRGRQEGGIRRRRTCAACDHRFTTFEVEAGDDQQVLAQLYKSPPIVVKQATELAAMLPKLSTEDRIVLLAVAHRFAGLPIQSVRALAIGRAAGNALRVVEDEPEEAA